MTPTISVGIRDSRFEEFLRGMLLRSITREYVDMIITNETLSLYDIAFTSKDANAINNYEFFEQLGDVSVNKFIVNYMYGRFPQLEKPSGVDIVAKLKIKYASKEQLQLIASKCGMWSFITATQEEKRDKRKKLLEDVFESYVGVTEYIVDMMYVPSSDHIIAKNNRYVGIGYNVIFYILKSLFDDIDISIRYEDIVASKTIINELEFELREKLGKIKYIDTHVNNTHYVVTAVREWKEDGILKIKPLGIGKAILKKDAEERAATEALKTLANVYKIKKEVPDRYKMFY